MADCRPRTAVRPALLLACCVVASSIEPWWNTASTLALEKALYVRGVECTNCTKKQLQTRVKKHAADPIDPELQAMYEEDTMYQKNKDLTNITKDELIQQMNETEGFSLDGARAERMWTAFQLQLESGAVRFNSNGTMLFAMPFTHRISAFLPAAVSDAIEDALLAVRAEYISRLPRKVRRRLEGRLDWAVESGLLYGVLFVLMALLFADAVYSLFATGPSAAKPKGD